jgi:hypothetical protein
MTLFPFSLLMSEIDKKGLLSVVSKTYKMTHPRQNLEPQNRDKLNKR